jgi:hypothetical protein
MIGHSRQTLRLAVRWLARRGALVRLAQRRAERGHAAIRRELLRMGQQLGDLLAFSGRGG